MKALVLTLDQRGSRAGIDLVPETSHLLNTTYAQDLEFPFSRTVGDEFQGLLRAPRAAIKVIQDLLHDGHWNIGLGIGAIETPLAATIQASRGSAFIAAREAVEASKGQVVAVRSSDEEPGHVTDRDLENLLIAVADIVSSRSAAGREVVDLARLGLSGREIAEKLDRSPQAVSQRLQAARYQIEEGLLQTGTGILSTLLERIDA